MYVYIYVYYVLEKVDGSMKATDTDRVSKSHVAHVNESCRTCEHVVSHKWESCCVSMSHVARINESCRTYQ